MIDSVYIPPLDTTRIVAEILALGFTKADLAKRLNVHYNTLDRWANGTKPPWNYGEALLILHSSAIAEHKRKQSLSNSGHATQSPHQTHPIAHAREVFGDAREDGAD